MVELGLYSIRNSRQPAQGDWSSMVTRGAYLYMSMEVRSRRRKRPKCPACGLRTIVATGVPWPRSKWCCSPSPSSHKTLTFQSLGCNVEYFTVTDQDVFRNVLRRPHPQRQVGATSMETHHAATSESTSYGRRVPELDRNEFMAFKQIHVVVSVSERNKKFRSYELGWTCVRRLLMGTPPIMSLRSGLTRSSTDVTMMKKSC